MDTPATTLIEARAADPSVALDALFPLVYDEMMRIVRAQRGGDALTMQTTEIVHEAYLRLVDWKRVGWQGRAHFFAVAGPVVRQIVVQQARRRSAGKRGGGVRPASLSDLDVPEAERAAAFLALDDALAALAAHDPLLARVVECRFFAGLAMPETAHALGLPLRTAERLWTRARAHLHVALEEG